ncbi:MAG: leucine-rich repeat protein [Ruminococcus sp.]|nr:leucine-rich repeat protein [Ruminococcus sp.]
MKKLIALIIFLVLALTSCAVFEPLESETPDEDAPKKGTMAYTAYSAPFNTEDTIDVPEELYPGDTVDVKRAVEEYYLYGFSEKDYKITFKTKYPEIVSVSEDGELTVLKASKDDEQIEIVSYKIKFTDGSEYDSGIYSWVINNTTDETRGFEYFLNDDDTVSVLKYKGESKKLTIPKYLDGYRVTGIKKTAFPHEMTEVNISSEITRISPAAFDFTKISVINVDSGNEKYSSDNGILYNKSGSKLLRFPPMRQLKEYSVPEGVREIGSHAFYECQIKRVKLPPTVSKIGSSAFASKTFRQGTHKVYDDSKEEDFLSTHSLLGEIVFSEGLEEIGRSAFKRASLESVSIPDSVKKIGESAFEFCGSLKSAALPVGLEVIEEFVFGGCPIASLRIPDSVTGIKEGSLTKAAEVRLPDKLESISTPFGKSLKGLTISKRNKRFSTRDNVLYNKNKTKLIIYPAGREEKTFTIPDTVKKFAAYAFDNVKLEALTVAGSVEKISMYSFSECTIDNLVIKDGVRKIAESAFDGCEIGGSVVIPDSVTSTEMYSFCDSSLNSFRVPKCVTELNEENFGFHNVKEIIIPPHVKTIDDNAFGVAYYDDDDGLGYGLTKPAIKGKPGTAAEDFARKNKLDFTALEE